MPEKPAPEVVEEIRHEEATVNEVQKEIPAEEKAASVFDSVHIPIRRASPTLVRTFEEPAGLTYVEEESPSLPLIRKMRAEPTTHRVMRDSGATERLPQAQELLEESYVTGGGVLLPIASVTFIGALVLIVVAASSILISSHTIVEAGKAASVGYSLQ